MTKLLPFNRVAEIVHLGGIRELWASIFCLKERARYSYGVSLKN